ncbi:unnamed protein product [Cylindrotheca closterium]|uniref:Type III pantothenate kinase n=1 Tax=Cylindrotheca closterium TaxID=2856 RepID=A0AAD2FQ68_9STRA|nr:unnamed protein product [Cylindrotheca closterium]
MPPRVRVAVWPEDAPSRFDENIISISAGNSNLNWALHTGIDSGFVPVLFWRTPPVLRDEQHTDDACTVLARHLPRQVHSIIFGTETADHHKDIASQVAARRKSPALSVYIVSTNMEHENGIHFLFKDVPSRVVRLQSFHFFSKEEGAYETIGVDRVSTLFSCKTTYPKRHVLCFDAGTAWTYTAVNNKGEIVGGGIAPGVGARFRCLADYCDGLPEIDHTHYHKALKEKMETNTPFPIFAQNTFEALMTSTFTEIANQTRYLVKHFLEKVKDDGITDQKPVVVVAGGDAAFLIKVLQKDFSGIIRAEPGASMPIGEFDVEEAKHLVHYGVGQLLCQKVPPEADNPEDILREVLKGNRIARRFPYMNYDGTDVFRGSIMSIKSGARLEDDLFFVRYDDGDAEHVEFAEIYDALQLYLEVGEIKSGEKLKLDQVNKSIVQMEAKSSKLKEDAPKRQEKREEELAQHKATDDNKKQAQSGGKRGRKSKDGPQKKKAKGGKETGDKRTMYINKRVAKAFEGPGGEAAIYFGTIDKVTQPKEPFYWHVIYDDEDEEEFDEKDILSALRLYQVHRNDDTEYEGPNASVVDGLSRGEPTAEASGAPPAAAAAAAAVTTTTTTAEAPPAAGNGAN